MGEFALQLGAFEANTLERISLIFRKVGLDLFSRIVLMTPVDTGRARANWQLVIGVPPTDSTESTDKGGGSTIAAGASEITKWRPGFDIWIVNNLAYIIPLEHGHSKQAPHGMVATTLRAYPGIVESAASQAGHS